MKDELDNYLVTKYPKIFINRYKSVMKSCMAFGFEHDDGWFWLLDQLCESIQSYIDNNNSYRSPDDQIPQVIATQVKEKFGYLNFYYYGGDDHISGMISFAEYMSQNICECCGSIENVGKTSGWIFIICKKCYDTDPNMIRYPWKMHENKFNDNSSELREIKLNKINIENDEN